MAASPRLHLPECLLRDLARTSLAKTSAEFREELGPPLARKYPERGRTDRLCATTEEFQDRPSRFFGTAPRQCPQDDVRVGQAVPFLFDPGGQLGSVAPRKCLRDQSQPFPVGRSAEQFAFEHVEGPLVTAVSQGQSGCHTLDGSTRSQDALKRLPAFLAVLQHQTASRYPRVRHSTFTKGIQARVDGRREAVYEGYPAHRPVPTHVRVTQSLSNQVGACLGPNLAQGRQSFAAVLCAWVAEDLKETVVHLLVGPSV